MKRIRPNRTRRNIGYQIRRWPKPVGMGAKNSLQWRVHNKLYEQMREAIDERVHFNVLIHFRNAAR